MAAQLFIRLGRTAWFQCEGAPQCAALRGCRRGRSFAAAKLSIDQDDERSSFVPINSGSSMRYARGVPSDARTQPTTSASGRSNLLTPVGNRGSGVRPASHCAPGANHFWTPLHDGEPRGKSPPSRRGGCQDSVLFCKELTTLETGFSPMGLHGRSQPQTPQARRRAGRWTTTLGARGCLPRLSSWVPGEHRSGVVTDLKGEAHAATRRPPVAARQRLRARPNRRWPPF